MNKKGQLSPLVALLVLGGILFGIGVLIISLVGAIVSMLRLPLAIIGGIVVFFSLGSYLKKKLDVGDKTTILSSAMAGITTMFIIYSLPLFWLIFAVGFLLLIYYSVRTAVGMGGLEIMMEILTGGGMK